MASWNKQANSIFLAVLELDRSKWDEYLDQACPAGELRREVEQLLAAHSQAGSFLSGDERRRTKPIDGDVTLDIAATIDLGDSIAATLGEPPHSPLGNVGQYRLISVLGEGGMGSVYLAQAEQPVKRTVALKVIKPGLKSSSVIARFESERQVLALMDHPGIARVLDAGETPEGLPYFVMELVKGELLTEYCDKQRLDLPSRLRLFREVCNAVQHAHQKGILHRDLKPSNILVASYDDRPAIKIIDFGLAKALESAEFDGPDLTIAGGIMGTPQYMSPEQADTKTKDIDTRTDIYSLGAILYELLAGSTPLAASKLTGIGFAELLRRIREDEPQRPSQRIAASDSLAALAENRGAAPARLTRLLAGELDWIVMKAIDKDREQRYASVGHLAEDITRFLTGHPVQAGPPSRRYRVAKFARRNKTLIAASTAILACLLVAVVGTTIGMLRASLAERRARDSEGAERRQRRFAEQAYTSERAALRQSEALVSELYDSQGDLAFRRDEPGIAALWFANSAALTGKSDTERAVNLAQTKSALQQTILPVATFETGNNTRRIRFSPSGRFVAAYSGSGVMVWDWQAMRSVEAIARSGSGRSFCWHPNKDSVAVGYSSGEALIWDAETVLVEQSISVGFSVSAIQFNSDGKRLACGSSRIRIWDVQNETFLPGEYVGDKPIELIAWNESGDKLAASFEDRTAILTDWASPPDIKSQPLPQHNPSGRALPVWCGDNELIIVDNVAGSNDIAVLKLDVTQVPLAVVDKVVLESENFYSLTLSDDGRALGIGGYRVAYVLDVEDLTRVPASYSFSNAVLDVQFFADSRELVAVGRNSKAIVARTHLGRMSHTHLPHFGIVQSCDAHPDGLHLVTVQNDGMATVWRDARQSPLVSAFESWGYRTKIPSTGKYAVPTLWRETPRYGGDLQVASQSILDLETLQTIPLSRSISGTFQDSAINHDGTKMALAYSARLVILDTATGEPLAQSLPLKKGDVASLDFSPRDNSLAVLYRNNGLAIINADNMQILWGKNFDDWREPLNDSQRSCLARFTPDGSRIVVVTPGHDTSIHVVDAKSGDPIYSPIKPVLKSYPCRSIEFSHDGKHLATVVNGTNAVRFWELETGREVASPILHPGDFVGIFRAAFSPDDREIVTANFDGFVRQFSWRDGKPSGPSLQHPDEVFDAQFVGDGRFVATACRDGYWRMWNRHSGKLACPPLQLGAGPESGVPVSLTIDNARQLCLANGDRKQLYVIDLASLLQPYELSVSQQVQLAEFASGQRLESGSVTGMDREEWRKRWAQTQPIIDSLVSSTIQDVVPTLLRAANVARTEKDVSRELQYVAAAFAKLPDSSTADVEALATIAQVVQRGVICVESLSSEPTTSIPWQSEAEKLRQRLAELPSDTPIPATIAHQAGDAWLRSRQIDWTPLLPKKATAAQGTELAVKDDSSVQASGPKPDQDTYTTVYEPPRATIRAVRLEAMAAPEDGSVASGRDRDHNFNLTQLGVTQQIDGNEVPVSLQFGVFSYGGASDGFPALFASGLTSGWHTHGGQTRNQSAVFVLEAPVSFNDQKLTATLTFNSKYAQATMRRYQLSATESIDDVILELLRHRDRDPTCRNELLLAAAHLLAGQPQHAIPLVDHFSTTIKQSAAIAVVLKSLAEHRTGNTSAAQATLHDFLATSRQPISNDISKLLLHVTLSEVLDWEPRTTARELANFDALQGLRELDRLIAASPNSAILYNRRTSWYARRQMWREAAANARQAVACDKKNRLQWLYLAPLVVLAEPDQYPQFALEAIERFGTSKNVDEIHAAAWIACIAPGVDGLDKIALDYTLEQIDLKAVPKDSQQYIFAAKAMVALRTGDFDGAIKWAERAHGVFQFDWGKGLMMAVTALSLLEQQKFDEAKQQIDALDRILPPKLAGATATRFDELPTLAFDSITHVRLHLEIARREFDQRWQTLYPAKASDTENLSDTAPSPE